MNSESLQQIVENNLVNSEKLIASDTIVPNLKNKKPHNFRSILFWVMYVFVVIFVVVETPDFEQGVIVTSVGKVAGIVILIFLAAFFKNFGKFFDVSSPSKFKNKYFHYVLTNERIIFASKKFKKQRVVSLHGIQKIDVMQKRNRITFYLDDPLEPTISFNGISNPLKLAKLVERNLPYCEEHAYFQGKITS